MGFHSYIQHSIDLAAIGHAWWLPLLITGSTVFFEDTTTAIVGLLSANGIISIEIAWPALALGILFGDLLLYGIGFAARVFPALLRWVQTKEVAPFVNYVSDRTAAAVITTRFLPGFRIPLYVGCGFFGIPFRKYFPAVILGAVTWTTFLYFLTYLFGKYTFRWLGIWRWPLILIALLVFFLVGRSHVKQVLRAESKSSTESL